MRVSRWIAAACCAALVGGGPAAGEEPKEPTVAELLDGISDRFGERAAEALARRATDPALVAAVRERLAKETDFHRRLALAYVLAAHGEKEGLQILVDALVDTGHLGYVYLTRVAPRDLGWDREGVGLALWRAWLTEFTVEEYRDRIARNRLPRDARMAGSEDYAAAAVALRDGGDRAKVAAQFRAFAAKFPKSDVAADATELAALLDAEAKEDAAWKEPEAPGELALPQRIARLVHHLRDARCRKGRLTYWCSLLASRPRAASGLDPAAKLVKVGAPAIAALLALLEDRRPIRAVDDAGPFPVVLRYQDAALEILNELLPTPTYQRPTRETYLSQEEPADRKVLIADIRSWAADTAGKPASEAVWAGLRRRPTRDALEVLRGLALTDGKKPEVLDELRRMHAAGPWVWRPAIVELMAELGDTSGVADVLAALEGGKYRAWQQVHQGVDGTYAEQVAERIRAAYGKPAPAGTPADPKPK